MGWMAWASIIFGILTLAVLAGTRGAGEVEAVAGMWLISWMPAILGLALGVIALVLPRMRRSNRIVALVGVFLNLSPVAAYFVVFRGWRLFR